MLEAELSTALGCVRPSAWRTRANEGQRNRMQRWYSGSWRRNGHRDPELTGTFMQRRGATPPPPSRLGHKNQVRRQGFAEFSTDIIEGVSVLLRAAAYMPRSNSVPTASLSLGLAGSSAGLAFVSRLCA